MAIASASLSGSKSATNFSTFTCFIFFFALTSLLPTTKIGWQWVHLNLVSLPINDGLVFALAVLIGFFAPPLIVNIHLHWLNPDKLNFRTAVTIWAQKQIYLLLIMVEGMLIPERFQRMKEFLEQLITKYNLKEELNDLGQTTKRRW